MRVFFVPKAMPMSLFKACIENTPRESKGFFQIYMTVNMPQTNPGKRS